MMHSDKVGKEKQGAAHNQRQHQREKTAQIMRMFIKSFSYHTLKQSWVVNDTLSEIFYPLHQKQNIIMPET